MSKDENDRNYFRIASEFQVRYRRIDEEELKVFKSYALRPSPYSTLRGELETQLQTMQIREESKFLFEKAFQLLMNIDQRLERMEEQLQAQMSGVKSIPESYEWVHGDLGAGGLGFSLEDSKPTSKDGEILLLDVILPSLPEYRLVAAGKVLHTGKEQFLGVEFIAIHEDDREFIHRFVIQREREMLRARAQGKNKDQPK